MLLKTDNIKKFYAKLNCFVSLSQFRTHFHYHLENYLISLFLFLFVRQIQFCGFVIKPKFILLSFFLFFLDFHSINLIEYIFTCFRIRLLINNFQYFLELVLFVFKHRNILLIWAKMTIIAKRNTISSIVCGNHVFNFGFLLLKKRIGQNQNYFSQFKLTLQLL